MSEATASSGSPSMPTNMVTLTLADLDKVVNVLQNETLDIKTRHQTTVELRDAVDGLKDAELMRFIYHCLPAVMHVLSVGQPSFRRDDPQFLLRMTLIEILQRMPHAESVKEHVVSIVGLVLQLLSTDNEDMGVICIKIIIDLNRTFRSSYEEHVTKFVGMVREIYQNMEGLVKESFAPGAQRDAQVPERALRSFKVLSECPIATVLLFQAHKALVNPCVREMLPVVVSFLRVQAPQQQLCREQAVARGTIWTGIAPELQGNSEFRELITAQVKTMSFLAYILRGANESLRQYQDTVPQASVRLLQDCPSDAPATRKELLVATRHMLSTDFRQAFINQIDTLLDERVLLGSGLASQEALRPLAYSMLADLVHHVRADLSPAQITRVVKTYSSMVHNPALGGAIQTMCAKLLMTVTDSITTKETQDGAATTLYSLLESDINKLRTIVTIHDELQSEKTKQQGGSTGSRDLSIISVEKLKPLYGAAYVFENPDDVLRGRLPFPSFTATNYLSDLRQLFRTLLHGIRAILGGLRQADAPVPDAELISQFFESGVRCLILFKDREPREEKEAMDWFAAVWHEVDPHVFQEVWTSKMEFFVEHTLNHTSLLAVAQALFEHETRSQQLVSISLRHFTDRLDLLGNMETRRAAVTIRFMKMAFSAVSQFPEVNEAILAPHLDRLIMDSFPLSAKSLEPSNYFILLKGLFRAIGGGQGRFEILYKGVLPLLPEMLESLSKMLEAAEPGQKKDLLIELNLTVPVRLTHLLKFLHYLVNPLVLALGSSAELVTQGLRTLELMVDNLTPDFLDPTLQPVLRELMTALSKHLRPLPWTPHQHSHTIIRTLGKLGGRNRRLLEQNPILSYEPYSEPATVPISFGGRTIKLDLSPIVVLAAKTLQHTETSYQRNAFDTLRYALDVLSPQGIQGHAREQTFEAILRGLFDALHIANLQTEAFEYLRGFSRNIFTVEMDRIYQPTSLARRLPLPLVALYIKALPQCLVCRESEDIETPRSFFLGVLQDLMALAVEDTVHPSKTKELFMILHHIASRFTALCFEATWQNKVAGFSGIAVMTSVVDLGFRWNLDREIEFVRALLFVLKDMPHDAPRNVDDVVSGLKHVLRICNRTEANAEANIDAADIQLAAQKIPMLVGVLLPELASVHSIVRQTAKSCLLLIAELHKKSVHELLTPLRERLLSPIFAKPLRALPFQSQIGNIDAMTFCLTLEPPLPDVNDELMRLLHEALALADADEGALVQRPTYRQNILAVTNLRVVCIKLLTASMPVTDFFAKHPATRQKVTSVYFKSLYSPSADVKSAAHEGLCVVLTIQSRLPRDLLQTGLRPILMNLADPKRLSVPGLEGLARLLELLTNYFKVEIGSKLLDHFRVIADPVVLRNSAIGPLTDNEEIRKLVRLVNIFHLLPPAANIFLEDLVISVVKTEAILHSASPSPFTEPLAKFLDRYPLESVDYFRKNLNDPKHVRTLRNVLQSRMAPLMEKTLMGQAEILYNTCLRDPTGELVVAGLHLTMDLIEVSPAWLTYQPRIVDAVLELWRPNAVPSDSNPSGEDMSSHQLTLMAAILCKVIEHTQRIDVLIEIVSIFSVRAAVDVSHVSSSLFRYLKASPVAVQRNIILRFLVWFKDPDVSPVQKTLFIRYVLTPLLHITLSQPDDLGDVIDSDIITNIHDNIWVPMNSQGGAFIGDDALTIELLNMSSILVHRCTLFVQEHRKLLIKCAWNFINTEDAMLKQSAYMLAARFFEAFDSPAKFILRALTGLLRPSQSENRTLIRQALDILMPALPKRFPDEPGIPQWAKVIRCILTEDGHNPSQLIVIYQLIMRHRELFFPWREIFAPHMVQSLTKLGLHATSTAETRLVSIDVLDTICHWEKAAMEQLTRSNHLTEGPDDRMEVDSGKLPSLSDGTDVWILTHSQREVAVGYFIRLLVTNADALHRTGQGSRTSALLSELLSLRGWKDVHIKLNFFMKALDQPPEREGAVTYIQNSMKVLGIVANHKSDAWYLSNAEGLQEVLQKGLATDDAVLLEIFRPILERFLQVFPLPRHDEDSQADVSDLHAFIINTISDGLRTSINLRSTLMILLTVVQGVPERIDQFSLPLMKLFAKLTKEHGTVPPASIAYDTGVRFLQGILEISRHAVNFFGDQRKVLLTSLVQLIEKSASPVLCPLMLDIVREWVLRRREAYPTLKEKANLLLKMQAFQRLTEPLYKEYLTLIYDIYTDPQLRRTDLTVRLEPAFVACCSARDPGIRHQFIDLLNASTAKMLNSRLSYVLGSQNWEPLAEIHWVYLLLNSILGCADGEVVFSTNNHVPTSTGPEPARLPESVAPKDLTLLLDPICRLLFLDSQTAHNVWVSFFPEIWAALSRKEQGELSYHMLGLLSKEYHSRQVMLRPNMVNTLLCGIYPCSPPMTLPPFLTKYLAKTFGSWHVALEMLQSSLDHLREDEHALDMTKDALIELYSEIAEEDMFYGLWRRRSIFPETNAALSFEQNGMWVQAQTMYETAQSRSRNGQQPFSEVEYYLWEDHWIIAAQKLQQWDILFELAKNQGDHDLYLESAWRLLDWNTDLAQIEEHLNAVVEPQTPRRRIFEALAALTKAGGTPFDKTVSEFPRIIDDAMQISLRKWVTLPEILSVAHVPLLQHFQQVLELQEAAQIFVSISSTTAQNLEKKSGEMKQILQAWRERLPNLGDDIGIWSDLVAWRQHVFAAINKYFIPLIQTPAQGGAAGQSANTVGYRGYHETAWIINRFAHVARKHHLMDVCTFSLNKIYTLPNIEISEAFLKLREQARCHYQNPAELQSGLDVINNTNLMYFSASQKAEFYTLKGMFFSKLGNKEEANRAFGSAVQMDLNMAKAWAEWGKFGDRCFQESAGELVHAASAVSCYLQAAGLYKSAKSRPLLIRVLWLLSVDDATLTISRSFDTYKGEAAFWYWITLIPQLLISLGYREAKHARYVLLNLAKLYPQALFFPLRTVKEDLTAMKRAAAARQAAMAQQLASASAGPTRSAENAGEVNSHEPNGIQPDAPKKDEAPAAARTDAGPSEGTNNATADGAAPAPSRQPADYVEEIVSILKTAFPLLALTMETLVDQINSRFKSTPEEDVYRYTSILLTEAISAYTQRIHKGHEDGTIPPQCASNATRFASSLSGATKAEFEEDIIKSKLSLREHIARIQRWRDRYEKILEGRPKSQPLDLLSHWLVEFQHGKFDDIEVPGQYLEHKDSPANFVKISRIAPKFEVCRAHGFSYRRITMHGHDATVHSFAVQFPAARHCRREERLVQLFRIFNGVLTRRKETRKRNISFHLPAAVPFNPTLRLVENDSSYITLQDIYDQHCEDIGILKEEPIMLFADKCKSVTDLKKPTPASEYNNMRLEVMNEVMLKMIPQNVISSYMLRTMTTPIDLWMMRKQFTLQLASATFMTYTMSLAARYPSRFHVSRTTGLIHVSEMLPSLSSRQPLFVMPETVPFRLTPNMQHFITPIGIEGLLTVGLMSIGRSLTEPEFDMDQQLSLFLRDEVFTWYTMHGRSPQMDNAIQNQVAALVDGVVKKAEILACKLEREQEPKANGAPLTAVQTISNLISMATNPISLSKMSEHYYPWF
ncbi:hypothetical protein SISSUDRAFT_1059707 [Sistotremastrum suecicum HHB10207 ss-3]|uniref:Atypical/PIKK/TRRAP protein kinase n=1 Tax=Sistotremastrum suecicum HHB10207 ss-3 TaxID=1314776 RepID=A0A166FZ64_9AGAM|nr:hypothetical protein SISSUDRAFT_1059707 [Sistotremastrum suecicum HHB10207 ss-3]